MRRLRALIERLLPWYDPEREAEKDAHAAELERRVHTVAGNPALRRSFEQMGNRMTRPPR